MKKYIFTVIFLLGTLAHGHGEDKAGPHGGYVRMPGAYHTELVPFSKNEVRVYLLDIDWKNPSTKDSSVELKSPTLQGAKVTCAATTENYFSCPLPKGFDMSSKGRLVVSSKRESQVGNEVPYELPLKFQAPANEHGHH